MDPPVEPEVETAVDDARRAGQQDHGVVVIGYGPFSRTVAERIAGGLGDLHVRLEAGVSPELLRRVANHELAASVALETPAAARRHGLRIDALRDEPMLAALPRTHRYAGARGDPDGGLRRGVRWETFAEYFGRRGFGVSAPEWPRKDGDVEELAGLGLAEIADHYERVIRELDDRPC